MVRFGGVAVLLAVLSSGCAKSALVQSDLPLQRVVIYRNGVAYFERGGRVDKSEIRFKMKEHTVGDFLATLAVMERGGSSVKSAAFPLDHDDERDAKPRSLMSEDEKKKLRNVLLSLDGEEHDLLLGYIAAAPVWRPSYRVVVQANGEAELQAWGIVQNLSGEDWKNVRLSLVAGAPIAFQAQLATSTIPNRPVITDEGEVVAAVPMSELSLSKDDAKPPPPEPKKAEEKEAGGEFDSDDGLAASGFGRGSSGDMPTTKLGKQRPKRGAKPSLPTASAPAPAFVPPPPPPTSTPRNVRSLASVAVESGSTRYDIPTPVTIPDESATMVLLVSQRVPGEALFLFAPEGGVSDSMSHPFRVVRFTNRTKGILERGPIAVFESGAFLGQGLVDPLPADATATVPFALDRAIAVESGRKFDETGERIERIVNGALTIERDSVTKTTYKVQNGSADPIKLLVKHARIHDARLHEPPQGTDDNVGTGHALVPVSVKAKSTGELLVDERATVQRYVDWFSVQAEQAIKNYIADSRADAPTVERLKELLELRSKILHLRDKKYKLDREQQQRRESKEESESALHSIARNKGAEVEVLRKRLANRLHEALARLDDINKDLVTIGVQLSDLDVQFRDATRAIHIAEPLKVN